MLVFLTLDGRVQVLYIMTGVEPGIELVGQLVERRDFGVYVPFDISRERSKEPFLLQVVGSEPICGYTRYLFPHCPEPGIHIAQTTEQLVMHEVCVSAVVCTIVHEGRT